MELLLKLPVIILILAVPLVFTFWAILDVPKRRFTSGKRQMAWLWVVATLPVIGALIYVATERRRTEPASQ